MDAVACDFWGLQLTARRFEPEPSQPQAVPLAEVKRSWLPPTAFRYPELVHVGSYFLALRRPVLDDRGFRRRLGGYGLLVRGLLGRWCGLFRHGCNLRILAAIDSPPRTDFGRW